MMSYKGTLLFIAKYLTITLKQKEKLDDLFFINLYSIKKLEQGSFKGLLINNDKKKNEFNWL